MEGVGDEVVILFTLLAAGFGLLFIVFRTGQTTQRTPPVIPAPPATTETTQTQNPTPNATPQRSVSVDFRVTDGSSKQMKVELPTTVAAVKQKVRGASHFYRIRLKYFW